MAGASGLAVEAREVWIHARPSGADHSGQERRHQPALVGQHLALTVHEDDPHGCERVLGVSDAEHRDGRATAAAPTWAATATAAPRPAFTAHATPFAIDIDDAPGPTGCPRRTDATAATGPSITAGAGRDGRVQETHDAPADEEPDAAAPPAPAEPGTPTAAAGAAAAAAAAGGAGLVWRRDAAPPATTAVTGAPREPISAAERLPNQRDAAQHDATIGPSRSPGLARRT